MLEVVRKQFRKGKKFRHLLKRSWHWITFLDEIAVPRPIHIWAKLHNLRISETIYSK
jgi:hypothetical protein